MGTSKGTTTDFSAHAGSVNNDVTAMIAEIWVRGYKRFIEEPLYSENTRDKTGSPPQRARRLHPCNRKNYSPAFAFLAWLLSPCAISTTKRVARLGSIPGARPKSATSTDKSWSPTLSPSWNRRCQIIMAARYTVRARENGYVCCGVSLGVLIW